MTKVSVIVPVYNVEKYLDKCLDSLVNQTLKEIEIIVVNDGTKDNSQKIIDKYVKKYPKKIKSHIKENGGQSSARNYGLQYATGEYIGFVDSDDYVELDMYEKLYEKAKSGDFDIAICNLNFVYEDKKNKEPFKINLNNDLTNKQMIKDYMINIYPVVWNKIYKKNIFDNLKFKEGVWFEDVELLYRMIPSINNIGYVDLYLYDYLQRDTSVTSTFDKRLYHYIDNLNDVLKYYKNNNYFETYKKELEYCYVRYLYATFVKRACNYSDNFEFSKAVDKTIQNVKQNFPNYRRNSYFYKSFKGIYIIIFNKFIAKIYRKLNRRTR